MYCFIGGTSMKNYAIRIYKMEVTEHKHAVK